jgi:hypothetical protein
MTGDRLQMIEPKIFGISVVASFDILITLSVAVYFE